MTAPVPSAAAQNVLREDLPLPVCVLRAAAVERNIARFQRFADEHGVLLSPHAKTAMSPVLFTRQLAAGCWGLTVATCAQLQVVRRAGVRRVFYANELVGAADIRFVCEQLRSDPGFEFYCLADSVAAVALLAERAVLHRPGRPLNVLVEVGVPGGRCGARNVDSAIGVAAAVRAAGGQLALAGVEGFEGLVRGGPLREREAAVRGFLRLLADTAAALDDRDLFDADQVLLSAGGSGFFDVVIDELRPVRLSRPHRVLLRSGCYLVHDWGLYAHLLADLHQRTGSAEPGLEPALEVWSQVLSVPEPGQVILSAGRRDFGQDAGNPIALAHVRRASGQRRSIREAGWQMSAVSDQHAHMSVPPGHGAEVGDLVSLGPSHPCTTLDKWRVIHLVDDDYAVAETIQTGF